MRGKEVAMVFQDPMTSLNPVMRVEDQIVPPMMRHLGLITQRSARTRAGAAASWSASPTRRSVCAPTRTSSAAACGSACSSPSPCPASRT